MRNQNGITLIAVIIVVVILIFIISFRSGSNKNDSEIADTSSYQELDTSSSIINDNNDSDSSYVPSLDSYSVSNPTVTTETIRKEFKDAMDSYESAMDEYITFMTKYANSNGSDPSLYSAYGEYMKKYIDATDAFEKWDGQTMNSEEAKYYIDVQTRVTEKLLTVSTNLQYQQY